MSVPWFPINGHVRAFVLIFGFVSCWVLFAFRLFVGLFACISIDSRGFPVGQSI